MSKFFKIYVVALLVMVACQGSDLNKMTVVSQESKPDEVSKDVVLTYSDSGLIKRVLKSPVIHKYTTDTLYTVFPEGVHAQFFNKKGEIVTELTCGYGVARGENNEKSEFIFRDNVRIKNHKKETLISDEIYLVDNVFHSDSTVYIVTPTVTLRGTSLRAPRDFSSYKLTNPVGVAKAEALNKQMDKSKTIDNK